MHNKVGEVDILRELLSTDIVMLIYSPCNLYDLNRQFLTNALFNFYFEDGVIDRKIEKIKQDIRNTPDWYASIEQKALANGQEVDAALEDNAKYMLYGTPGNYFDEFKQAQKPTCRNSRIAKVLKEVTDPQREMYRTQIYNNQEWLNSIKGKAEAANLSLEEAIERDIDWLLKEKGQ